MNKPKIQPTNRRKIGIGVCECTSEPRGQGGLEGYNRKDRYLFQRMQDSKGKYIRMFPEVGNDYYETCGTGIFKQCFDVVQEYPV